MNPLQSIEISLLIAVSGCFVGLAGWLKGRDGKIANDAEWKGSVTSMLGFISDNVTGIRQEVEQLDKRVRTHDVQIASVEASAKAAHKRLDTIEVKDRQG